MEQIIQGMMAVFFTMLMLSCGIQVINSQIVASEAKDYRNYCIACIENSDYQEGVMMELLSTARQKQYDLKIKLFFDDGSTQELSAGSTSIQAGVIETAQIEMKYHIKIPILQSDVEHVLVGACA